MKKKLLAFVASAALVLTGCGSGSSAEEGEEVTIRLAVGDPAQSSVGVAAQHFADLVSQKTDGRVEVKVYPDGTLFGGDQNAAVNQVQSGSIDATILSTSVYASFEPRMNAISIPYLFEDFDQYVEYLEGDPGQTLLGSLEKLDTKGLAMMTRTFRQTTNSERPITEPSDLKGIKLRVPQNDLWVKTFKSFGANPTPMDFTEVYTALELGVIDGQENPIEVPLANKFYEVQKYLSLTNHIADAYILGMNQAKFEGMDKESQRALTEAAQETAEFKRKYDDEEAEKAIAELESKGMKVNELTDEQQAEFTAQAERLYPQFDSLIGKDFVDTTLQFVGRG